MSELKEMRRVGRDETVNLLRFQLNKWRLGEGDRSEGMRAGPRSSQGWVALDELCLDLMLYFIGAVQLI
jgi:hypothetical protein